MNRKQWEKGMEGLDDELIDLGQQKKKRFRYEVYIPLAATAAAAVLAIGIWSKQSADTNTDTESSIVKEEIASTTQADKNPSESVALSDTVDQVKPDKNNADTAPAPTIGEALEEAEVGYVVQGHYMASGSSYNGVQAVDRKNQKQTDTFFDAMTKVTDVTGTAFYDGESNYLYSPSSLIVSLAMLGQLENEAGMDDIYSFLGITAEQAPAYAKMIADSIIYHSNYDDAICDFANSLWFKDGLFSEAAEERLTGLENVFKTDIISEANLADTAEDMKAWLLEKAGADFKLPPVSADELIRIINVVNFSQSWATNVRFVDAENVGFINANGEDSNADMMYAELGATGYIENDRYTMATLPYEDGSYMLVFLPKEGIQPGELLSSDITSAMAMIRQGIESKVVNITMPAVSYSYEVKDIRSILSSWIEKAFTSTAFDGMVNEEVSVDTITQSTNVKIDKQGTAATAVTLIKATGAAAMLPGEEPLELVVDRPFAYAICAPNGTIIYEGIVNNADK